MSAGTSLSVVVILLAIVVNFTQGGCEFKKSWIGRWFQSGVPNPLYINSSFIETKGECIEEDGDKYLMYDRTDGCYRCLVIHEKDTSVLQYKEGLSEHKSSLNEICEIITGDAQLISLFRKYPEAKPVPCPFKGAPFTFSYNRGTGDCNYPPSKAESCTDDSRLVLKYNACPDVPSTESNVEELTCLATWKEGSTRYLVGRIVQPNRMNVISDEDQYRCFIYKRETINGKTVYNIGQSGDATCTGISTAYDGSRTMRLIAVDNQHYRCKFPVWITEHHTWFSLDHKKTYKFSQKNATLKILDEELNASMGKKSQHLPHHQPNYTPFDFQSNGFQSQDQKKQNNEMRVVCHGLLSPEEKKVKIVAHVTAGCTSGYVCMMFYKRDTNVIEMQQSEDLVDNPEDACANFDPATVPFTTLITTNLSSMRCPNIGRYTLNGISSTERRKKRQQPENMNPPNPAVDCLSHDYEALAVGCSDSKQMEFRTTCAQQSINAYSCHGSWEENGVYYVITSPVARRSTDALRYCFIYTINHPNDMVVSDNNVGNFKNTKGAAILRLSSVSESCHRHILPGINGNWAFNFTSNGTCAENGSDNASSSLISSVLIVCSLLTAGVFIR